MLSFNQFINESKKDKDLDSQREIFNSLKKGDTVQWSARTSKIVRVSAKDHQIIISGQGDREIPVSYSQWVQGNGKLKSTNSDDK